MWAMWQRWDRTTVQESMRPLERIRRVAPDAPASEPLEMLGREDLNQLAVMSDGRLEGVVSRGDLIQVLQTRAELNMRARAAPDHHRAGG